MLRRVLAIGLLGFVVAACGTVPPEQRALQVLSVAPQDGAAGVPVNASVTATFSADVDVSSLEGNFTLVSGGELVEGTVNYAPPFRRATFTPDDVLDPGEYVATLTNGVRSAVGGRLGNAVSWGFVVSAGTGSDPGTGPGPGPDPTDPDPVLGTLPSVAFLSPTPDKRLAGLVDVEVELDAPLGIRRAALSVVGEDEAGGVRVAFVEVDPQATRVPRDTLSVTFSTLDFEAGAYDLLVELEDVAGNVTERSLRIVMLPPVLITTPTYAEVVGLGAPNRQIVAVTIGVNGTILDDYDVTSFDLFINGGLYAAGIVVNDGATSTRLAIFEWDTLVAGPGHDVTASGDRMLTARVTFIDPDTGVTREEFTPGVLVDYQP